MSGCAVRQRVVVSAQTVADVRGCEKIGIVELSRQQIAIAIAMLGDDNYVLKAKKDNCDKMGGNVILGSEGKSLCFRCNDLNTEYEK